jgi:hypothetical protein
MFECTLTARVIMYNVESQETVSTRVTKQTKVSIISAFNELLAVRAGSAPFYTRVDVNNNLESRFRFESLIQLDGLISTMRWCFTEDEDEDEDEDKVTDQEEWPVLDNVNVTIMSLDPVLVF